MTNYEIGTKESFNHSKEILEGLRKGKHELEIYEDTFSWKILPEVKRSTTKKHSTDLQEILKKYTPYIEEIYANYTGELIYECQQCNIRTLEKAYIKINELMKIIAEDIFSETTNEEYIEEKTYTQEDQSIISDSTG